MLELAIYNIDNRYIHVIYDIFMLYVKNIRNHLSFKQKNLVYFRAVLSLSKISVIKWKLLSTMNGFLHKKEFNFKIFVCLKHLPIKSLKGNIFHSKCLLLLGLVQIVYNRRPIHIYQLSLFLYLVLTYLICNKQNTIM